MKNKKILIGAGALAVLVLVFLVVRNRANPDANSIVMAVKSGPFKVEIETTGELEAKNSVKILGPNRLIEFEIWQVVIQNIVDEGTVVKKGDWVATLDQSSFQTKFTAKQIELEKENAKYVQTQLDTTLVLREARDKLVNLKYAVEEKRIVLEQSKYEPPATIKQAQIDVEKANREFEQARENYKIKQRQNAEKMREQSAVFRKVQGEFNNMTTLMEGFTIKAPEPGMVIYTKGWDGRPIKAGSQIQTWNPTVATLPDLTKMMSKTYVNEVDVRKVLPGQKVEVGLDAYPDKKLTGVVAHVANVGEQRPNSDSKVFEVAVEIDGTDATLRPSMTTSNKIISKQIDQALYIPLESLHSHADSVTFVYKRRGLGAEKQEVVVGEANNSDVIVVSGLANTDEVYLSVPSGMDDEAISLLKEMNGKRKKKGEEIETKTAPASSPSASLSQP